MRTSRSDRRWMFALAWTLGVVLLAGCGPVPRPQLPPGSTAPATATLAVVVTDAAGVAKPGAHVTLHTGEAGNTNADGYLAFEGLVLGERGITVSLEGYQTAHAFADPFVANLQVPVRLVRLEVPPPVVAPSTHPHPLRGRLRRAGPHAFADDSGLVTPLGYHDGTLVSQFFTDPQTAEARVRMAAGLGYQMVRSWLNLPRPPARGGDWWRPWGFGPSDPGYWATLHEFLNLLARHQMRLVASQGDPAQLGHTVAARSAMARRYAQAFAEVPDVVAFVDFGNECQLTDTEHLCDDPANLYPQIAAFKAAGGTALTSTISVFESLDDINAYSKSPADVGDWHPTRAGDFFMKIDHLISLMYEDKPPVGLMIESEGPAFGPSVTATENMRELDHETMFAYAAAALYSRQAYVHFFGPGVRADKDEPLEQARGWRAVPKLLDILPRDVMAWDRMFHSGDTWRGTRIFAVPATGRVRMDGVLDTATGRVFMVGYGEAGSHTWTCERSFTGTIYQGTADGVESHPFSATKGDRVDIRWGAPGNTAGARVLVGRVVP